MPKTKATWYNPFSWKWDTVSKCASEYALTAIALAFIANGIAVLLVMFGKVEVGEFTKKIIGATAFAYSGLVTIYVVNRGVKKELKDK